ncbi:MAG: Mut7-C RNAse domain-containing protein [bacterium]
MNFVADRMLGKLAKQLRMLGYDTIYYRGEEAYRLIKLARGEGRVILTRNTKLLPKTSEDRIVRITEDRPSLQIRELIQKGYISLSEDNLLSRCLLCNVLLDDIPREEAEGKVPDFIFYQQKEFYRCPRCLRIYWQGSHQENMLKRIEELRNLGTSTKSQAPSIK